ncbi:GYF domain-containing protein [Paenibacillus anseongense]|uniref:GYF domain-containing protein n=1 Tax=Paenibacillus anseongense TaxID=2682845 RepID=UPI002DB6F9EE|nr:GYF domain-containing protein [Paenibacillus anseongense]MEC0264809.1 GYF domain-containing protein [Paenibacillus anseongense]
MIQDDEKWFYKQGHQENGPFTTEEMNNLIQKCELKLVTSVKRFGQEWNAAESFKELHFGKLANSIGRPWSRYWARGLDMLILGFLMGILMSILPTISFNTRLDGFFLGITTFILSIPFEACLLKLWEPPPVNGSLASAFGIWRVRNRSLERPLNEVCSYGGEGKGRAYRLSL